MLRSAWNACIVSMLGGHNRNFAWGGSMALRRETFDRIGVREAWHGAVSDDYAVTRAAERAGAHVVFIPTCLVPTYGDCGWHELLQFTTRQITITRVYHPRLWRIGFFAQSLFNGTFIWLTAVVGLTLGLPGNTVAIALWLTIFALAAAKSWIRLGAVKSVLPYAALSKHIWFYILSSPLVALLFEYNMLRSAFSRRIVWRQIRYNLISPNQTRVERPDGSGANAN